MTTKLPALKALSLALLLSFGAAARAEITVFTSKAEFLAAITGPVQSTDTFDNLAVAAYGETMARMAGGVGYLVDGGIGSAIFGAGGTGGDFWLSTNNAGATMAFSQFSQGVYALGGNFFGSDIAGSFIPNTKVVLSATDGAATRTFTLVNTTTDSFVGFISTQPIRAVTFHTAGANYWPTANNMTLAVPEADSYVMLLAGLLVMGWLIKQNEG
ncbi:MAG: PEP-CTERM sorting domain-containing protein [Pseudomonadota bacterium]